MWSRWRLLSTLHVICCLWDFEIVYAHILKVTLGIAYSKDEYLLQIFQLADQGALTNWKQNRLDHFKRHEITVGTPDLRWSDLCDSFMGIGGPQLQVNHIMKSRAPYWCDCELLAISHILGLRIQIKVLLNQTSHQQWRNGMPDQSLPRIWETIRVPRS